jgi:hypothetical protein
MLRSTWRGLPLVARIGLSIAALGLAADLVHHVFTHDVHAAQVLAIGFYGHVLTLVGMVVTVAAVVQAAVDSRRRARQKGEGNVARSSATATR